MQGVPYLSTFFYVEDSEKNYQNIILFLEFPRRALLLYDRRRMSCNLEKKITDDVVCYMFRGKPCISKSGLFWVFYLKFLNPKNCFFKKRKNMEEHTRVLDFLQSYTQLA